MGAQELPDWARATAEDEIAWIGLNETTQVALDNHAHRLVARMPKPEPLDPLRFALNKVTDDQWEKFSRTVAAFKHAYDRDPHRKVSVLKGFLIADLSTILPVAEPVKPLAELPDEALIDAFQKAGAAYGSNMPTGLYEFDKDRYEASLKLAAASLRASLSAYAPPPRVEVTPEVASAFQTEWAKRPEIIFSGEDGYEFVLPGHLYGLRAAFAVANERAKAKEVEAAAEVAQLRTALRLTDQNGTVIDALRPFWVKTFRFGWVPGLLYPAPSKDSPALYVSYAQAGEAWHPSLCILRQSAPGPHEGDA
jgi:hypothetical protein